MKKSLIIILLISVILIMTMTYVYAANTTVTLEGTTNVTPGSTGTITVKVSSSDTIGVVSGVITTDSNITIESENDVVGLNGWSVTYNSQDGKFNAYKAKGATSEEIIKITYKAVDSEGTGSINVNQLQVVNVDYDEEELSDITKSITIKNQITDDPTNDPTDNPADDPANKPADDPTDNPTDDPANNPTDNTDKTNTGTSKDNSSLSTSTTATKTLPYAGMVQKVVLPMSVILLGIVGVGTYFGYRKYRGIK